jgi:hypothetical protein
VPRPRLDDDGQTLTLDLHGATVDEALRTIDAAIIQAARYGRASVRVVHGLSTSEVDSDRITIMRAFHDELAEGVYNTHVTSSVRLEGSTLLGIAPSPSPIAGRVRLADLY